MVRSNRTIMASALRVTFSVRFLAAAVQAQILHSSWTIIHRSASSQGHNIITLRYHPKRPHLSQ